VSSIWDRPIEILVGWAVDDDSGCHYLNPPYEGLEDALRLHIKWEKEWAAKAPTLGFVRAA